MQFEELRSAISQLMAGRTSTRGLTLDPTTSAALREYTLFLGDAAPLAARVYCIVNNITSHPTCHTCNDPVKWGRLYAQGFQTYCSTRCKNLDPLQQLAAKQGMMNKHGVENASCITGIQQKKRANSVERHGVDHPSKAQEVKDKVRSTNVEKYGVAHPMMLESFRQRAAETNMERYGVPFVQQNPLIHEKTVATNRDRYGRHYHVQRHLSPEVLVRLADPAWLETEHLVNKKSLSQIARELGLNDMTIVMNYAHRHNIRVRKTCQQSVGELELRDWLSEFTDVVHSNRTVIAPLELDIVLPQHNVAIEYCGLYWHSEQMGKDAKYHRNKLTWCERAGYRLITMFEDEWITNKSLVKQKLLHVIGVSDQQRVYARNLVVRPVCKSDRQAFLLANHIQGDGRGSVTYGLYDKDVLNACITFYEETSGVFVLNRFATSTVVVGGFTKLLTHFKRNHNWNMIKTFADRRWSEGALYSSTGFTCDAHLAPDYCYVVNKKRVHKFNMRHSRLRQILPDYDPLATEWENCDAAGFYRLWDCGKDRYIMVK